MLKFLHVIVVLNRRKNPVRKKHGMQVCLSIFYYKLLFNPSACDFSGVYIAATTSTQYVYLTLLRYISLVSSAQL